MTEEYRDPAGIAYPKLNTLYERKEDFTVDVTKLTDPSLSQIDRWLVTEKIDGTNIRISLGPEKVSWNVHFGGRTKDAQMPVFLLEHLQKTFTLEKMQNLWLPDKDGATRAYPITLFGEGYGARIQKGGGNYREGVSFRLFDVLVDNRFWLDFTNVQEVARKLGISTVPRYFLGGTNDGRATIPQINNAVVEGLESEVAKSENDGKVTPAEGVVARTDPYLYDKFGKPLKFKLKTRDFTGGKKLK